MSQVDVNEVKSAGSIPTKVTSKDDNNANSNSQPNVRHIPIFVEGRDEPIINRNIHINSENVQKPVPTIDDCPPQSIFNRAKNIPVRKPTTNFDIPITNIGVGGGIRSDSPIRTIPIKSATTNYDIPVANINRARSESPGRTIPIKVEHIQTKPKSPVIGLGGASAVNNKIPNVNSQLRNDDNRSRSPSPMPPKPQMDSITKIQLIQKEIIELMKRVEMFGGTRKDKEYMYLDEMLTQNLLKLDTIDTEGKENIKAARKEAINCINKCIAVLEAKVEQGEKDAANAASTDVKETETKMDTDESQTNATNPEQTQNSEKMNIESEQKSQNDSDNRNKIPGNNP